MKKHILFLTAILLLADIAHAQTLRLTSVDNSFRAGDMIVKQQVEYKDPGTYGRDKTWDFAFLQSINDFYEVKYFYPDSSDFSLVCGREPDARYYFRQAGDTVYSVGFENNTSIMEYTLPELKLRFPFQYGDTLYSRFEGSGQYGRRVNMVAGGYTRVECDADGTLKIPDYPDGVPSLRVHSQRYYEQASMDSLQMKIDTWHWYVRGTRYPVFESVQTSVISFSTLYNGDTAAHDTAVFQTSFYYPPSEQTNIYNEQNGDVRQPTAAEQVFTEADWQPNPVVENLYITYKLTRAATIWFSVHSNGSIPLCQTPPQHQQTGYNETVVPMSSLPTGSYTVYVHVDDMAIMQTVVKR